MSQETPSTFTQEITEQAPTQETPPVAPVEKTYRYQANDDLGRPIGRPTVIKYTSDEELVAGIQKAAHAIEAAQRTPDPKPAAKEPTAQEVQKELDVIKAQQAGAQFVAAHPDYYNVAANGQLIAEYLQNRDLPKTLRNIEIAYAALNLQDALIQRPTPAEIVVADNPPARTAAPATPVAGVKPGSSSARFVSPKSLTLTDVVNMPTADYKRRMKDPQFVALVNRLGFERKQRSV